MTGRRLFLAGLVWLFWVSIYLYMPILAPHVERLGGSLGQVGAVLGAYGITQMLLRVPLGLWSDRLGKRRLFVAVGFGAAMVSGVGLYLAVSPGQLALHRALAGVTATAWVAFAPLFAAAWPPEDATRAMGVATSVTSLAHLTASLGGGALAASLGWPATFLGAALLGAVGAGACLFLPREEPRAPGERREWAAGRLLVPSLWSAAVLAALLQYLTMVTSFGFVNTQAVRMGATEIALTLLGVASGLPGALSALLVGNTRTLGLSNRAVVVAGFVFSAALIAVTPYLPSVAWLVAAQAGCAFLRGLLFPVFMGRAMASVGPESRAGAMGVYQAVYASGMVAGPIVAGAIGAQWGLEAVFGSTALFGLLFGAAALPLMRRSAPLLSAAASAAASQK